MHIKKYILTLSVFFSSISLAQTNVNQNLFSESVEKSPFDIIEVKEPEIEKKEMEVETFEGFLEKEEQKVPLFIVKNFCKENIHLFENSNLKNISEKDIRYKKNESINKYCERYVSILKDDFKKNGILVNNFHPKPIKQGELVDDLWIDHSVGQNEGIRPYVKNNDVQVRTVKKNSSINYVDITSLTPIDVSKDNQISVSETLSDGEEVIDEKTVVINTNEKIKELQKEELMYQKNQELLKSIVINNELIGKTLNIEDENSGDIDMSELIDLLPSHMKSFHIRVIKEGMQVTLDFRDTRLNIMLDKKDRIKSISIG